MANTLFFLGAGFSKSINEEYPLLKGLTENVLNNYQKDSLAEHFYTEIPMQTKGNIEYLLTYLSTDLPWKNEKIKSLDKALYIEIVEHIQKYFIGIENTKPTNFSKYKNLTDFIVNNNSSIITLNYDLIVEDIIQNSTKKDFSKIRYFYHNLIKDINEFLYTGSSWGKDLLFYKEGNNGVYVTSLDEQIRECNKYPLILKLHGSINWYYDSGNPTSRIYCKDKNEDSSIFNLTPYIIPPVMDKNMLYSNITLKYMWQLAHEKISVADEIYIIGFSFPNTDTTLRYLFQSALKNKPDTKIYVINYNVENTKATYKDIFKESQLSCNLDNSEWKYLGEDGFNRFLEEIINNNLG